MPRHPLQVNVKGFPYETVERAIPIVSVEMLHQGALLMVPPSPPVPGSGTSPPRPLVLVVRGDASLKGRPIWWLSLVGWDLRWKGLGWRTPAAMLTAIQSWPRAYRPLYIHGTVTIVQRWVKAPTSEEETQGDTL